ncbi:hypothetical protein B5807_00123 [Epicoccum nigrum]|uniref:Uncharacterized protein n=1 Tax=Epicoccum nigrum TaxID=105696 RepID=A0A1Y2MHW6_EPING|nr:hypothetical protein B5807_00123 [Epicoccum nigrum]
MSSYSESDSDSNVDTNIPKKKLGGKSQELTDGIARAEARLDVLDEAIEDAKDNLNTFLHKHGVAKSAIYCYGHFGKIGEIKDLEELERQHFDISMELSVKFIQRSRAIRRIMRKKAARDKLVGEMAGDTDTVKDVSATRLMGDSEGDIKAFLKNSSSLESCVMGNAKKVVDRILDPESETQLG